MAGSANTPPNGFVFTPGSDAGFVVAGTSTQNDGRYARAYIIFDPNTGSYIGTAAGGLNTNIRNLTPSTDTVTTRGDQYTATVTVNGPWAQNQDFSTVNVAQVNRKVVLLVVAQTITYAASGQALGGNFTYTLPAYTMAQITQ